MSGRLKRRIVIAAVVLGVVGLGGTALATSSSGGNTFLDDVAHRLGIAPAKLQEAINGAKADQLNQLVKQGKLTRAQAKAIEQRMQQHGGGAVCRALRRPVRRRGFHHHFRGGPRPGFGFGLGPMGLLQTAATYLGVSQATLSKDLRSGKTLAAVAKANGKPVSGLETALVAPAAHPEAAVQRRDHRPALTKAQAARFLEDALGRDRPDGDEGLPFGFGFGGPMHHGWDGDHGGGTAASPRRAFGLLGLSAGTSTLASPSTTCVSPTHARVARVSAGGPRPRCHLDLAAHVVAGPDRCGNRSHWPR